MFSRAPLRLPTGLVITIIKVKTYKLQPASYNNYCILQPITAYRPVDGICPPTERAPPPMTGITDVAPPISLQLLSFNFQLINFIVAVRGGLTIISRTSKNYRVNQVVPWRPFQFHIVELTYYRSLQKCIGIHQVAYYNSNQIKCIRALMIFNATAVAAQCHSQQTNSE